MTYCILGKHEIPAGAVAIPETKFEPGPDGTQVAKETGRHVCKPCAEEGVAKGEVERWAAKPVESKA